MAFVGAQDEALSGCGDPADAVEARQAHVDCLAQIAHVQEHPLIVQTALFHLRLANERDRDWFRARAAFARTRCR